VHMTTPNQSRQLVLFDIIDKSTRSVEPFDYSFVTDATTSLNVVEDL
jgi:hypothetical protein